MVLVTVRGSQYYIHSGLIPKWDKIKDGKLTKKDEDKVYCTDGRERIGKSLFTIQQAAYIDPTILDDGKDKKLLPRITFDAKETLEAIKNTESKKNETKCIIFDEAFRGMSSKGALSKENKMLTTALMEMGQKNLVLFIVSPSFFLLELYPAMIRSNALFHVLKDKNGKRYVRIFNYPKKAVLYQNGIRKGWSYNIPTRHRANFFNKYPGGEEFKQRYIKKKRDSLKKLGEEPKKEEHRWVKQRNIALKIIYEKTNLTYKQISKEFERLNLPFPVMTLADAIRTANSMVKQTKG